MRPEHALPSQSERESGPIRSVKDFVKRYFPSAVECPHCNGTGIKRGSDAKIDIARLRRDDPAPLRRERDALHEALTRVLIDVADTGELSRRSHDALDALQEARNRG